MVQDPLTLYKLITLYMLDCVTFPLTKAQVCAFILVPVSYTPRTLPTPPYV